MGNKNGNGQEAVNCLKSLENTPDTLTDEEVRQLISVKVESDDGLLALEPRILLDAAGFVTGGEMLDQATASAEVDCSDCSDQFSQVEQQTADLVRLAAGEQIDSVPQISDENSSPGGLPQRDAEDDSNSTQFVFVDPAVDDIEGVIKNVDPSFEIVVLDPDSDGVEQIAEYLEHRENIDAIHIISHGRSGTLDLGSTKLTAASMAGRHADELEVIRDSLSEDADILLYGCNFAEGARGAAAISALADSTGADVAASVDITGAATLGGDWELEVESGDIEVAAITAENWEHTLAATVLNGGGGILADGSDGLAIHVVSNGQLQVGFKGATQLYEPSVTDDSAHLFNGVYLAVGNTVAGGFTDHTLTGPYAGPANGPGIFATDVTFVEAGQTVTGTGTGTDPYIVNTTMFYDAGGVPGTYDAATDFEVEITTTYIAPNPYFTQSVTITPPAGNTDAVKFYHTLDTFLNINVPFGDNPDEGPGFTLDQTPGNPSVVGVARDADGDMVIDSFAAFAEVQGGEEFDQYYSAQYDGANLYGGGPGDGINDGGDIVNTVDPNPTTDNGLGIQFNLDNSGVAQTFTYHIAFRGEATIDLDADDSSGATGNAYDAIYTAGSGATIPIVDSDVSIQNVVGDIDEVRIELTNSQAGDSLTVNVAGLPPGVGVQSQTATQIILEATGGFGLPEATFDLALQELGFTTTSLSDVDRNIDFAVTNELGEEGFASAGTIAVSPAPDNDGDGVPDLVDVDDDKDGILDVIEDAGSNTTETVILFDFDENNPDNAADADQGFTARASFGGADAILVHSETGVNGNGQNNGNGRGGNNARFDQIAAIAIPGVALDPDFLEPDFTRTFGAPTITANGFAEGTFTIDAPNGVPSLDGNGFIGGFDRLNNPTDIISPNLQTALSEDQLAAFELGRFFTFDHLNFSGDEQGGNNFNTRGVVLTLIGDDATVSAIVETDINLVASGAFQTISVQLTGESFGVTDAELNDILDDIQQFSIRAELIGAASSTDVRNSTQVGDDVGEAIDRIERFAVDNIRITNDADGDGIRNSLDLDSDNDGITDNIEAQTTTGYIAPSGIGSGIADANMDGLDDNFDARSANGVLDSNAGAATVADVLINPVDTDGDGSEDFVDLDSDNDGDTDTDTAEADLAQFRATGLSTVANDADGDGLFDVFDAQNGTNVDDGYNVNEDLQTGAFSYPDIDGDAAIGSPLTADVDFRDRSIPPIVDLNSTASGIDTDRDFSSQYTAGTAGVPIVAADADVLNGDAVSDFTFLTITPTSAFPDGANEILQIAGVDIPLDADFAAGGVTIPGTSTVVDISFRDGVVTIREQSNQVIPNGDMDALIRSVTYRNVAVAPNEANTRTFDFQVAQFDAATFVIDFEELTPGTQATPEQIGSDPWWALASALNGQIQDADNPGQFNQTLADNADGTYLFHNTSGNVPNDQRIVYGASGIPVEANQDYSLTIDIGRQNTVSAGPFDVLINGNSIGTINVNSGPVQDWQTLAFSFNSGDVTEVDLQLRNTSTNGTGNDFGIDNIVLQRDPLILSNVATASVEVVGNAPPVAQDDNFVTDENTDVSDDLFVNNGNGIDSDINGHIFTVTEVNGVPANVGTQFALTSGALLTVNANGTFNYELNGAFDSLSTGDVGNESFTYTIDDGNGGTDTATVNIVINGSNDAPVVDLNGALPGTDYTAIFVEDTPGEPLANLLSLDAVVQDDEDNIATVTLTINLPVVNDGSDELFRVDDDLNQLTIDLSTGVITAPNPLAYGSTTFQVVYNAGVITIQDANSPGATMESDDVEAFMREFAYVNTSQNNIEGERSFEFQVIDPFAQTVATSTITVQRANDAPVPVVDPGGNGTVVESGTGDVNPAIIFTPQDAAAIELLTGDGVRAALDNGATATELGLILVEDLLDQLTIADIEQTEFGIGLTFADEANGRWQYLRTDLPTHEFTDFEVGDSDNDRPRPVSDGLALLFNSSTIFRFIPDDGFVGSAEIQFRVWDQSIGTASNPPSTILDDSGGSAPTATSSLSSTVFTAGVVGDYDGDSVNDIDDLDDDNDGILDTVENAGTGLAGESRVLIGANLYQSFDGGTFGFGTGAADESPATDPYSGSVTGGTYDQFVPTSGLGGINHGEYSYVSNQQTLRSGSHVGPSIDPVYGATGRFFLSDPNTDTPTLSDTVTGLVPGATYEYSFWAATPENSPNQNNIDVFIDGVLEFSTGPLGVSIGTVNWTRYSFTFIASAAGTAVIDLASTETGSIGNDFYLDNIELHQSVADTDGDGIANSLDLDSDNDGISDLIESGQDYTLVDIGNDGVLDDMQTGTPNDGTNGAANGLSDAIEAANGGLGNGVTPVQTDGDGIADYLDLDSDGDGIADQIEAQPTATYQTLTNINNASNFGVNDIGLFVPSNTDAADGDTEFDFRDLDSDNDLKSDAVESGITLIGDNDGNGIDDAYGAVYGDGDGTINSPQTQLADELVGDTQVAYRERPDTDGDGVDDVFDLDDDNDGILDNVELGNTGPDDDNDGVSNAIELLTGLTDPSNPDSDGDGLLDAFDPDSGLLAIWDTDGDGIINSLDLDSDNDGISDLEESGSTAGVNADTNNDGTVSDAEAVLAVPAGADQDNDGLQAVFDLNDLNNDETISAGTTPRQTADGDGIADFIDLDSDGDGIADAIEALPTAGYASIASTVDTDDDGVLDIFESTTGTVTEGVFGGNFLTPQNTDAAGNLNNNPDGLADYIDTDSDGDGILDAMESGLGGLPGDVQFSDPDGTLDPETGLTEADGNTSDVDYRSLAAPIIDLNDDNTTADLGFTVNPYTENDGLISVTDTDADVIAAADNVVELTIAVAGATDGDDEELIVNGIAFPLGADSTNTSTTIAGVPVNLAYIGGTLNISAIVGGTVLPQAALDAVIRAIQYQHTSDDPTDGDRTLTFNALDANGLTTVVGATSTITVFAVNDPPVINLDPNNNSGGADDGNFENTFTEGLGPVAIVDPGITIVDPDAGDSIAQIDVLLTNGQAGDILNIGTPPVGITIVPVPAGSLAVDGTISVTITGSPTNTAEDYEAALQAITYEANGAFAENPDPTDRIIEFVVHDAEPLASATVTTTMHVVPVNDAPALNLDFSGIGSGYTDTFTEGGSAVPIADTDSLISDLDDTDMESVTITLTNGQEGDLLTIGALPTGISLVGSTPSILTSAGVVTFQLMGTASIADYQTAIESITFSNNSTDPSEIQREISVVTEDGDDNSNTAMALIDVDAVNDPPQLTIALADQTTNDGNSTFSIPTSGNFNDPDDVTLTYTLGAGAPAWLQIDATTGVVTVNGAVPNDGSQNTNIVGGTPGTYDVQVVVTDSGGLSANDTFRLTVSNLNPTAVDDMSTGSEDVQQGGNVITDAVTGDGDTAPDSDGVLVSEVDGMAVSAGSPAVVNLTHGMLTVNEDGSWTFDPNGTANALEAGDSAREVVTYTITDDDGGTATATLTIDVTGVNDPVVVVDPTDPTTDPTDPGYDPVNPTVIGDPDNLIGDVATTDGATPASIPAGDYFADAEDDTLTFGASDLPPGLMINPVTGEITGTLDNSASQGGNGGPGVYDVVIMATDPQMNTATTTVTYTITNPDPTAVDDMSTGSEDVQQGGNVITDAVTGDGDTAPDSDGVLVSDVDGMAVSAGSPAVVNLTHGMLTVNEDGSWTFDPNGTANALGAGDSAREVVTYTITDDDGGTATATLTIDVTGVNDPVVVVDPTDPTTDPTDPGYDPVNPTVIGDPDNLIGDVATTDGATPASIPAGDYFADAEDDTLTFGASDLPPGLTINPMTGEITGTLDNSASQGGNGGPGVYDVVITATDPQMITATTTVTYMVANISPVVDALIDDQIDNVGTVFSLDVSGNFSDPDADDLSFSATGLPEGLFINPVSGVISGTIDPRAFPNAPGPDGEYTVIVTADDNEGGRVSTSFVFKVVEELFVETEQPDDLFEGPNNNLPQDSTPDQNLIVDRAVNAISSLGSNIGLDSEGLPITQLIDWIDDTNQALARMYQAGLVETPGDKIAGEHAYIGGDAKATGDEGDAAYLVRSLVYNDRLFLELIAPDNEAYEWSLSLADGTGLPDWVRVVSENLAVIHRPVNVESAVFRVETETAEGDDVTIKVNVDLVTGRVSIQSVSSTNDRAAQGFSGQLMAARDAPIHEVRAFLKPV